MTDLTEFCYSHTNLKPLTTCVTGVKKMHVLVLNKTGRAESIGDSACRAQVKLGDHLVPLFHIAFLAIVTQTVAANVACREIRVIACIHSTYILWKTLDPSKTP